MPRRQLLLVVVVVGVAAGPLDPGSGLTGTLHYSYIYVSHVHFAGAKGDVRGIRSKANYRELHS